MSYKMTKKANANINLQITEAAFRGSRLARRRCNNREQRGTWRRAHISLPR